MSKESDPFDMIIITGEYHDDHPLSPSGIINRVLVAKGFKVGIIEKPLAKADFLKLGTPKLCFCVTSGSIDSMLNNYTPLKKKRELDKHSKVTSMPDRAVIFYCNKLREFHKGCRIVIGGVEASLRRFAHYDYWDNDLRKSILLDSRADILVYGHGEKQIIEIADRLKNAQSIGGIEGTCVISKELPKEFNLLPSFKQVSESKEEFCKMQVAFSNYKNLAQEYDTRLILQYKSPEYTQKDLDWIYGLPYTRRLNPKSLLKMARFSVVTHRGCVGNCNFCSIPLHHGSEIISRSESSILEEIRNITKNRDFKGFIDDLGGPSANMYGMDCKSCGKDCMVCGSLDKSHKQLIQLMKKARAIPGIKKIFVRSGIRYDLALESKEYVKELSEHHISGGLKIAPEHFSKEVLKLMNKDNSWFDEFVSLFKAVNARKNQHLKYYFMICHPGETLEGASLLSAKLLKLKNIEQFQLFTPTPMTVSTCMYWTGMDPYTLKNINVIRDYKTKKEVKRIMLKCLNKQD